MKQFFLIFIIAFFSVNVESAQLKNQEERVTDLVIINDVYDIFPRNMSPWEITIDDDLGAFVIDLNLALFDNQLVLCTKSSWFSLQNFVQVWNDYVQKSEKELFELFQTKMPNLSTTDTVHIQQDIKDYKSLISQLNEMYKILMHEIKSEDNVHLKHVKVRNRVKEFQKILGSDTTGKFDYGLNILFTFYVSYQIILEHDYDCRNASDDFLVFIPKDLVPQAIKNTTEADIYLGLFYSNLTNYDYKTFATEEEINAVFSVANRQSEKNSLGVSLLNVLKKLRSSSNINMAHDPFFNILIGGHGDPDSIAEISIHFQKNGNKLKKSDLLKILDFFNYSIRTKSVGFMSCYSGGKKIVKTFDIANQFNNINLEKISYPIIFIGSFFALTSGLFDPQLPFSELFPQLYTSNFLYGLPDWKKSNYHRNYFNYLNDDPIDYEGAAESVIDIFDFNNKNINFDLISNYASIKYPHTSWFTPLELKTEQERENVQFAEMKKNQRMNIKAIQSVSVGDQNSVQGKAGTLQSGDIKKPLKIVKKISQIEASTTSIITIDYDDTPIEIVLLQANVIKQINIDGAYYKLPVFLPVNYHNQNYVINLIKAPDYWENSEIENSQNFHQMMRYFLPIPSIEEPVNIVIKELQTSNEIYTNVYAFTHKILSIKKGLSSNRNKRVSGYMYTDSKNQTKIVTWPSGQEFPTESSPRAFSSQKALEFIAEVEQKAAKNLKSFENIESMLATEPKPEVFKEVERSKMLYKQEQAAKTIQKNYRKYKSNRALKTA